MRLGVCGLWCARDRFRGVELLEDEFVERICVSLLLRCR